MESKLAVFIMAENEDNEILLLKRPSEKRFCPDFWGFPGGHVKDHETMESAVVRELLEETGMSVDELKLKDLGIMKTDRLGVPFIIALYKCRIWQGLVLLSKEHKGAVWVKKEDVWKYLTMGHVNKAIALEENNGYR